MVAGVLSTAAFILGPQDGVRLIESHPAAEGSITTETTRIHTRKFHEYATNQKSEVSGLETRQTRVILHIGGYGCWWQSSKCLQNRRFFKQRETQNL